MDGAGLPTNDEQERILSETKSAIKKSAFQMRKAIDDDNMREALRFAATMLGELRTSYLSPQKYYELYMVAFDQLMYLESFFGDEHSKGRKYSELYELVQHAGNVLPRLYLMILVGCLYIKSGEVSPRSILKDLVELCKGVQHPTRGLFVRAYLCQRSRPLLPQNVPPSAPDGSPSKGKEEGASTVGEGGEGGSGASTSEVVPAFAPPPGSAGVTREEDPGSIHDSIDFLLSNFVEMNKLWVRMQYQGSARDRERRERERTQLQDLVGKNLTFLSQLDGLDFMLYSGLVLPRVLEQVVSCRDDLAQQYLLQAVIQGFPDSFHLDSLEALLGALPELQLGVKIHTLMASLMTRLAKYAASDAAAMTSLLDMDAFDKFRTAVASVVEKQTEMPMADMIEMYVALTHFVAAVHPGDIKRVNEVLGAAYTSLSPRGSITESRAEKQLVALLTVPLSRYDVVSALGLSEYPSLMTLVKHSTKKELAVRVVKAVLEGGHSVDSVEREESLFKFVIPLVEMPEEDEMDEEELEDEQVLVARLVHHLQSPDPDTHAAILRAARTHLERGGAARMRHTLPALVFCTLQLVRRLALEPLPSPAPSTTPTALLQWLLETGGLLSTATPPQPLTALRLLLACAAVASEEAGEEMLAYQFFEEAFELYETYVSDAPARVTSLMAIISTLHKCCVFTPDNRDTLVQNVVAYCSRLLHRSDQCRAVCAASHLSWQDERSPGSTETPSEPATAESGNGGPTAEGGSSGAAQVPESSSGPNQQPPVRDGTRVLSCLKRALKMVAAAKQQLAASARQDKDASYVGLYVEILNHYLFYFERGVDMFTPGVVQQVAEVVAGEVSSVSSGLPDAIAKYWGNTKRHVEACKAPGSPLAARFATISL